MAVHVQIIETHMVVLLHGSIQFWIAWTTADLLLKWGVIWGSDFLWYGLDLTTVPIHQDKSRHHFYDGFPILVSNDKGTVAKETVVGQGLGLNGNLLINDW